MAPLNAGDEVELEDGCPYCSMRAEARLTAANRVWWRTISRAEMDSFRGSGHRSLWDYMLH